MVCYLLLPIIPCYNIFTDSFVYMFHHLPIYIVFLLLFLKWLQNVNYFITLVTVGHTIFQKDFKMCHAQSNI